MTKIPDQKFKQFISAMLAERKERKFVESIDLQIGLKDYDPNKDKRFTGSLRLPHVSRPNLKICFIADAAHIDKCKAAGIEYIDQEALKLKRSEERRVGKEC